MPFCDLFSKNRIRMPKIRTLKNIWVSHLQKMAKSCVFYRKIAVFYFPKSSERFQKKVLNLSLWYLLKAYF